VTGLGRLMICKAHHRPEFLCEFHFSSKYQLLDLMMGHGGRFWALPE